MEQNKISQERLRLMVFKSALELGKKVNDHLLEMYGVSGDDYSFILPIKENFFEDGHLKVEINDTVRSKDVYMLTDIGNYAETYKMHGFDNHMSPNDWMAELKDGIAACNMHSNSLNIVMPLLYAGRQHRRNTRESLACGNMLREIDANEAVRSFITFDAHDQGVEHAVSKMEFDNFYPTNEILGDFINDVPVEQLRKLVFVAPDNGAAGRRNVYLNSFAYPSIHREAGSFIKQRDYNNLVDGKYPVVAHDYCGNRNLKDYTAIVSDDMISSGGSMFDVVDELKKLGVAHIYIMVTYALFTRGIGQFREYFEKGLIDGVYTTNLSFIPAEYQKEEWLHVCDCSKLVADVIYHLHNDMSISEILRDKSQPVKILEKKFNPNGVK